MTAPEKSRDLLEPQAYAVEHLSDVEDATRREHELTLFQAIKLYPKAVAWSMVISAACIMDGYDFHVLGSLYAQPAFRNSYGSLQPDGTREISAAWQSGLNNGTAVGVVFGLYLAGTLTDRFGLRRTIMGSLFFIMGFIFLQFFANSLAMLEAAQVLLGMPLAVFQTITIVYAVEVAPVCLRAFLTSYVSQMWVIGQILSTCVIRGTLHLKAPWAYRVPFAIQWLWPIPLGVVVIFAPESPWWLVRQNRLDEAKRSLRRLASGKDATDANLERTLALMVVTTEHERTLNSRTSYAACFRGTDLRRTLLVIFLYCMQIVSGTTLRAFATYFFEQAGLPTTQAFNMSMITYSISFIDTVVAWFLMPHVGRRTLFLSGLCVLTVVYFVIGGLGIPSKNSDLPWAVASLLVVNGFVAYVTVLPMVFTLTPEIPSTLLRTKTVPIGRAVYSAVNVGASILTSYQINPTAWDWAAKTGFFWAGASVLGLVVTYFVLPETKDRTIAEIDLLFEKRVSARKFASTDVHATEIVQACVVIS